MRKRKKYKFTSINGKTYRKHRLVVEQALGRKLNRCEAIHHIDENGLNNDLTNLHIINERKHNILTDRQYRPSAKLKIEDIESVRRMQRDNIKTHLIAFAFGVHRSTINDIGCGRSWSWV